MEGGDVQLVGQRYTRRERGSDVGEGRQPVNGMSSSWLLLWATGAQFHQEPLEAAENTLFSVIALEPRGSWSIYPLVLISHCFPGC